MYPERTSGAFQRLKRRSKDEQLQQKRVGDWSSAMVTRSTSQLRLITCAKEKYYVKRICGPPRSTAPCKAIKDLTAEWCTLCDGYFVLRGCCPEYGWRTDE